MLKMTRRRAALAGAFAVGAVALTGCSKPTPLVTLQSDSDSVHAESRCSKSDFKGINPADQTGMQNALATCLAKNPKTLRVDEGRQVNVGVEDDVKHWTVYFGNSSTGQNKIGPIDDQTFTNAFTVPQGVFAQSSSIPVGVVSYDGKGNPDRVWAFQVEKS